MKSQTRRYFITSSGTGSGKTLVTAALCHQLRDRAKATVSALKPVVTGWRENDGDSDTLCLLRSLGRPVTAENIQAISPFRYTAPLAPDMAAAREGRELDFDELIRFCRAPLASDFLLTEGVGGVMATLTPRHTVLDWIVALGDPVILTAGSYLGSISHTLTAYEVLKGSGAAVNAVIVSESADSAAPLEELEKTLLGHLSARLIFLPRIRQNNYEAWKYAPDLLAALE